MDGDGDGDDDLDGFLLGGDESDDATTSARQGHTSGYRRHGSASITRRTGDGRSRNSTCSSSSLSDGNSSDGNPPRKACKKKYRVRQREQHQRRQIDSAIDAELSSSSGGGGGEDDENLNPSGKSRKRQSRLKTKPGSEEQVPQARDRYREGDAVEARFGGRSKWFPGKVRRAYEEWPTGNAVYNIEYDDGDKEEGVVAGRVRRPGQGAPTLQAGAAVDVKLARKGKGYHAGTIGQVNDDGSFYVKLDDGDSEWSIPAQKVIPAYPFEPISTTAGHDGNSPGSHNRKSLPTTKEEDSSQSSAGVNGTPTQETTAAETTTEPPAAPPPDKHESDHKNEQGSEDNGGGGGGVGVSWIAELASSVGVLPAGKKKSTAEADKQPEEANGLSWIQEVVSHVGGPGAPKGSSSSLMPNGAPDPSQNTASMTGNVLPSRNPDGEGFSAGGPTTFTPAAAGLVPSTHAGTASHPATVTPISAAVPIAGGGDGGGETPPGRTKAKQPLARIPTHLTWKPISDGTASRPWGAPPPDEDQGGAAKGDTGEKQEMASPPRVFRNPHSPETSSAVAGHTSNSQSPPGRQDQLAGPGDGGSGTNAGNVPLKAVPPSSSERSKQESGSGNRLPPGDGNPPKVAAAAGVGEPKLETSEKSNDQGPHSSENIPGEISVTRDLQSPSGKKPGSGDTESNAEARKQCPEEPPKKLPPLQKGVSTSGPGDSAGRNGTRWDTLRSSVQRRYAAEALHSSEEVRLLTAKLKAADDKAQARLAQQERQLMGQMEEVLRRERVKMQGQLTEERASNARRVGALQKELDAALRQLELERSRSSKGATRELLHGRRAKTPPPLGHTTTASPEAATRRVRRDGRREGIPRVQRSGRLSGTEKATTSRRRSASNTAPASTGMERRHPPPPPPPPLGATSFVKSLAASAETHTSCCGKSDRPGISALPVADLTLPPTPAEAAAVGRRGLDTYGNNIELPTVEGGGTDDFDDRLYREERLRWRLETERRDTRRRLEDMKAEVERVVGQFRSRAERAEAEAASAEKRATVKALRYLRSKAQAGKADLSAASSVC